jgi:hypothetical protein
VKFSVPLGEISDIPNDPSTFSWGKRGLGGTRLAIDILSVGSLPLSTLADEVSESPDMRCARQPER